MFLPARTNDRPRRVAIAYLDDGTRSEWLAPDVTPPMRGAAQFGENARPMFEWYSVWPRYFAASAPKLAIPPVQITREGSVIHVRSQRGAERVALMIHARMPSLRVNGIVPPPERCRCCV